jgi:hypothetical protein
MARWQVFVVCLGCFVAGAASQSAIAQRNRLTFSEDLHVGKDPRAAARSLLDGALELADDGSGERIAVGRGWYLGGDKARGAFDHALAEDAGDDTGMIEYGAYANLHGDRARAESLFTRAFQRNGREFWHWVGAGGSYLGVRPQ